MELEKMDPTQKLVGFHLARWERLYAGVAGVLCAAVLGLWAAAGGGYFWPRWVWFGLALPFVVQRAVRWACDRRRRSLFLLAATGSVLEVSIEVTTWLLSGLGYFWPMWSLISLSVVVAIIAIVRPPRTARERHLDERVGELSESRRTAVEIHAAELRRVERDLHDGAQARLVALGMSLGMAEELLDGDPDEARRLLASARTSAGDALADLRHLVRGIHPPVLADRGLDGAIRALAVTLPLPVEVAVDLDGKLAEPVESAVYFAAAECLTNVVKHSGATTAWVGVSHAEGTLVVVVGDDGRGGAQTNAGGGLCGIERRLDAFDGTVTVVSPSGGPTIIRVEVPCELSSPKTLPS